MSTFIRAAAAASLAITLTLSISALIQTHQLRQDFDELGGRLEELTHAVEGMRQFIARRDCLDCRPWTVAEDSQ